MNKQSQKDTKKYAVSGIQIEHNINTNYLTQLNTYLQHKNTENKYFYIQKNSQTNSYIKNTHRNYTQVHTQTTKAHVYKHVHKDTKTQKNKKIT